MSNSWFLTSNLSVIFIGWFVTRNLYNALPNGLFMIHDHPVIPGHWPAIIGAIFKKNSISLCHSRHSSVNKLSFLSLLSVLFLVNLICLREVIWYVDKRQLLGQAFRLGTFDWCGAHHIIHIPLTKRWTMGSSNASSRTWEN